MRSRLLTFGLVAAAAAAACGNSDDTDTTRDSGTGGTDGGTTGQSDSSTTTSDSGGGTGTDGGGTGGEGGAGGTCGAATLFAGNPNFAEPSMRPADGANILSGTPYLYHQLQFMSGGQILVNDQLSVWRIDTASSELHAVAGGSLNGDPELLAAAAPGITCSSARFGSITSTVVDSKGDLFVSDYTNAILKITNPLTPATCMVSYFAGTAKEVDSPNLNQGDGNTGTADGTGSAAQFLGPQFLTIDASDNLYLLDHSAAWSIRKITPAAVVTTLATFPVDEYAFGQIQYLNGKIWFWARGNDASDLDTANLIAINPTATTAVVNPPALLTLYGADLGGDSSLSMETGGIVSDGTKLYVEAVGQIFSVNVTGTTPVFSASLAGESDDTWSEQGNLDFASGYDPTASHTAATVELLALDKTEEWGEYSFLSRDPSGSLYFSAESADVYVVKIATCP